MKINKTNSVEVAYVSPSTNVVTLSNEGVLCTSGDWNTPGPDLIPDDPYELN